MTSQTKSKTESLHMGRISPRKNKNISIKNVVTLPATKKYTTETETFHTGLDIPSSECPSLCHTPRTQNEKNFKISIQDEVLTLHTLRTRNSPKYHNKHRYDMKHKVRVYNTVNLTLNNYKNIDQTSARQH